MAEGGTAIHYASDLATKMVRESFGELPEVGAADNSTYTETYYWVFWLSPFTKELNYASKLGTL